MGKEEAEAPSVVDWPTILTNTQPRGSGGGLPPHDVSRRDVAADGAGGSSNGDYDDEGGIAAASAAISIDSRRIQRRGVTTSAGEHVDDDSLLREVGSIGKFQRGFIRSVIFPVWFFLGAFTASMSFAVQEPPRFPICPAVNPLALPELPVEDTGLRDLQEGAGSKSLPLPSAAAVAIDCDPTVPLEETDCTTPYFYPHRGLTVVSEFMVAPRHCESGGVFEGTAWTSSAFFLGFLVGAASLGRLGDAVGRRCAIGTALFVVEIAGVMLMLSGSLIQYGLSRLFLGVGVGGGGFLTFVLVTEFTSGKMRPILTLIQSCSFALGCAYTCLLTVLIPSWRLGVAAVALPAFSLLLLPCRRVLQEGPRWLASRGYGSRALEVWKYVAEVNGGRLPAGLTGEDLVEVARDSKGGVASSSSDDDEGGGLKRGPWRRVRQGSAGSLEVAPATAAVFIDRENETVLQAFRVAPLKRWAPTLMFFWFTSSMSYYGIYFQTNSLLTAMKRPQAPRALIEDLPITEAGVPLVPQPTHTIITPLLKQQEPHPPPQVAETPATDLLLPQPPLQSLQHSLAATTAPAIAVGKGDQETPGAPQGPQAPQAPQASQAPPSPHEEHPPSQASRPPVADDDVSPGSEVSAAEKAQAQPVTPVQPPEDAAPAHDPQAQNQPQQQAQNQPQQQAQNQPQKQAQDQPQQQAQDQPQQQAQAQPQQQAQDQPQQQPQQQPLEQDPPIPAGPSRDDNAVAVVTGEAPKQARNGSSFVVDGRSGLLGRMYESVDLGYDRIAELVHRPELFREPVGAAAHSVQSEMSKGYAQVMQELHAVPFSAIWQEPTFSGKAHKSRDVLFYNFNEKDPSYPFSRQRRRQVLSTLFSFLLEIPTSVVAVYLACTCVGRRGVILGCYLFAAIACCAGFFVRFPESGVPQASLFAVTAALFTIARLLASGGFLLLYLYSSEIFPTVIRATSIGICSTFARVGGILAPLIVDRMEVVASGSALVVFGVCCLVAFTAGLCVMPETRGLRLSDTVAQMQRDHRAGRKRKGRGEMERLQMVEVITAEDEGEEAATSGATPAAAAAAAAGTATNTLL